MDLAYVYPLMSIPLGVVWQLFIPMVLGLLLGIVWYFVVKFYV